MAKRVNKTVKNECGNKVSLKKGETIRSDGMLMYRYIDTDGKRKVIYSSTIEGLREKESQLAVDNMKGLRSDGRTKTLDEVFHEWKELKRGIRDHTMQNYSWVYSQYAKGGFGKNRIKDISPADVRRFYNGLYDDRGLAVTTIDNLQTVIRQVFDFALQQRYIDRNPSTKAMTELRKAHNDGGQKHEALTLDEQKRFLNFLRSHDTYNHWYPTFAVMVGTGMRVGELTGLRWSDIDFETGTIDVNHTLVYFKDESTKKMEFKVSPPKSKAGRRTIKMLDFVKDALLEEKAAQEAAGASCKAIVNGYTDFVFINRFGDVQHQGTLNKALRRIIRDANYEAIDKNLTLLPAFSCHNLRTTFCTRLAEESVPLKISMKLMGHDDMRTTMAVYTSVCPDWEERELQSVNNLFKGFQAS